MNACASCVSCIIAKAEKRLEKYKDYQKNDEYMHCLLKILYDHAQTESAPWLSTKATALFEEFFGEQKDFTEIKHMYNQLMLSKEKQVEERIRCSQDPLVTGILYACAGNYIDFGTMLNVNSDVLMELLDKVDTQKISEKVVTQFRAELATAKELVYLTDNCGEIVMDKIFIRYLKELYPKLHVTIIVRGANALNDATMEDAKETGLVDVADCIGNGTAYPGTVLHEISEEARNCIKNADVIISKGQGNFESLYKNGTNPYYMFLCKCDLFVKRFGLEKFSPVVMKEEHIKGEDHIW